MFSMFSSTPTPLPNTAHDAEYAGRVQGHTVRRAQETARFHGSTLPFMLFCASGRAREVSSSLHGGLELIKPRPSAMSCN